MCDSYIIKTYFCWYLGGRLNRKWKFASSGRDFKCLDGILLPFPFISHEHLPRISLCAEAYKPLPTFAYNALPAYNPFPPKVLFSKFDWLEILTISIILSSNVRYLSGKEKREENPKTCQNDLINFLRGSMHERAILPEATGRCKKLD